MKHRQRRKDQHNIWYVIGPLLGIAVLVAVPAATPAASLESGLKRQASVSERDAQRTALGKVPGGRVKSGELEREGGRLVWSFDIARPGTANVTEVQVDAKDGSVVSTKTETPAQQADEARHEKSQRK